MKTFFVYEMFKQHMISSLVFPRTLVMDFGANFKIHELSCCYPLHHSFLSLEGVFFINIVLDGVFNHVAQP